MKFSPEVTCIGEVLVDFVSTKRGTNLSDAPGFLKLAGGAPANVAVGIARLGTRSAFIGKVGDDPFGKFLQREITGHGVDASGISFDTNHRTRLAFVSISKSGDRDFEFWEKSPADEWLLPADVDFKKLSRSTIVAMSSFLLIKEPSRTSFFRIAKKLRRAGTMIAFDPNVRLSLWHSPDEARKIMLKAISLSHVVRMNDEEARFLAKADGVEAAAGTLLTLGPELVVVTLGKEGSYFRTPDHSGFMKGYEVNAVDTTGCGDGFFAGLLHGLVQSRKTVKELALSEIASLCLEANAVGALTATRGGAIPALPDGAAVKKFLKAKKEKKR